jgi:acyl-coenzyme A synthetase/AMP-(fatty) acid ligase
VDLLDGVTRVGNWLIEELDVGVGEVVAVDGGNSPEYLLLWFALDAVGASISFVNWNLTGEGLVHCVKVWFSSSSPLLIGRSGGLRQRCFSKIFILMERIALRIPLSPYRHGRPPQCCTHTSHT